MQPARRDYGYPLRMARLILIKHAAPLVTPSMPSETWVLSEAGKHACSPLAEAIAPLAPTAVIASLEPKAAETGELLAARLGLPFETAAGLHEHDRSNVPHMQSREFISLVELFFRRPNEQVLGRETAEEAVSRFQNALDDVIAAHPTQDLAVVSHGTVIALLLEKLRGGRGFELWRKMGLPSFAVIDLGQWRIEKIVERIG
jgi:broad specificity phosphatase PhoE